MKRNTLIQFSVIIIGLISGIYSFKLTIGGILSTAFFMIGGAGLGDGYYLSPLSSVLSSLCQLIISWYLIKRSADIAKFICDTAAFSSSIKLTTSSADIIFIVILSLGIYYSLDAIVPFIKGIILEFKNKAPHHNFEEVQLYKPTDWLEIILRLLVPLMLLAFSKQISQYFSKDLVEEEVELSELKNDHLKSFEE